mmetsp:Transcript_50526/g.100870  ORF Transcript_50526/g.100870 Transcript_50526/m.100870 type:complete len:320 (-) Transcript_50526:114-1073(-)|eukprot:CAMPEP_0196759938 /NCGR_PEP_ID=MMETSP1091-20130531/104949_1 /TAXON_ID=302021 /ORGANISM="Rhodomonas sp., Strain CCMP768" /LENGTH=319 /DNA_ID=CAMNT_0042108803 /DNA_START=89 /DNA_END=1048 /DNA_ORIENTATION=+
MAFGSGYHSLRLRSVLLCVFIVATTDAFGTSPTFHLRQTALRSSKSRVCPSPVTQLRAEEKREPADGSLEKILGNLGPTGARIGKGIDWFFDTSTISGAKAWRLQVVPGEADAARFRGGEETVGKKDIEDVILDQIQSRKEDGVMVELSDVEEAYANQDSLDEVYSMTDEDLGASLTTRLKTIAFADGEDTANKPLTGAELALMCYRKYGLYHDMALKCDMMQLVSDKRMVSVNLYYAYYGQLNPRFQYSEAEYLAKLDAIALAVNQWQQADYVREFFAEKPTAYRGLPSRPRWDTAVSIRLNKSPTWDDNLAADWFLQ